MVRYVLVSGVVTRDKHARLPGRGAWLHDDEACRQAAAKRGGFARSFRQRVTLGDGPGA
ncbi:MAG: YlxR family protein [Propionibacteriaceae bacterium]|nr:YlxR family protein [Propionibacteriaceae bacterium]